MPAPSPSPRSLRGALQDSLATTQRRLALLERDSELHRDQVSTRAPCAWTSPDVMAEAEAEERRALRLERLWSEARDIQAALLRMDRSPADYRVCASCGGHIEDGRLQIIPWTDRCSACASLDPR